jgi:hypothetical protein
VSREGIIKEGFGEGVSRGDIHWESMDNKGWDTPAAGVRGVDGLRVHL